MLIFATGADMGLKAIFGREIFWHITFWLCYLFLRIFVIQLYPGTLMFRAGIELLEVPLKALALYFAIYILIRRLLLTKHYFLFIAVFVLYILVVMLLNRVEDYFLIYPLTGSDTTRYAMGFWNLKAAFLNLIYLYPVVGLGGAFYFVKRYYDIQLQEEKLLREKTEAEMQLLKAQLHPHFLFNTLNNIYSLAQAHSALVPEMMLKLSKLLSFMLYDSRADQYPVSKEVEALRDYIELEKLRLGERLEISFEASGDLNTKIAPLLLFPFVENCFKHGSHKTIEKTWISFNLFIDNSLLIAQIENAFPKESNTPVETGLGLNNVRKRLALLYPGRHELKISEEDTFLVILKLKLE